MTSAFFSPAAGLRETALRRWLLLIMAVLTWTTVGTLLTAVAYLVWPEPRAVWQEYVANFIAFVPLFCLLLLMPKILGRPSMTAITSVSKIRWSLVWLGFWSWGLMLVAETLSKLIRNPSEIELTFPGLAYVWPFLISLMLLPLQTSSEELLFRGAIPQALTSIFRNPIVVLIVSGVLFGAAHLSNPEAQKQPFISLVGYSVTGIGWGWVTYKTAGLELAIGAHTVNNFYALLIVGYSNSAIQGSAIWTTPEVNMKESTITNLLMMGIWLIALRSKLRAEAAPPQPAASLTKNETSE